MKQPLPYKRIIFVCLNDRPDGACCNVRGSQIKEDLKSYVKSRDLKGVVRISGSGCMDQCALGPNIMIFPDNIWYHDVTANELEDIKRLYIDPLVKNQ